MNKEENNNVDAGKTGSGLFGSVFKLVCMLFVDAFVVAGYPTGGVPAMDFRGIRRLRLPRRHHRACPQHGRVSPMKPEQPKSR